MDTDALAQENKRLVQENNRLVEDNHRLDQEIHRLTEDNHGLYQEIHGLTEENHRLNTEIMYLHKKIDSLNQELYQFRTILEQYEELGHDGQGYNPRKMQAAASGIQTKGARQSRLHKLRARDSHLGQLIQGDTSPVPGLTDRGGGYNKKRKTKKRKTKRRKLSKRRR